MFFKSYHKEHVFKIIKQKSITFLSWSSRKSNKDIFPGTNLRNGIHCWYLHEMKFLLSYIRPTPTVFSRQLGISSKSGKHSPTLKSNSHLPKKSCLICLIESSLKVIKNAFYFIIKALFVLTFLSFCHVYLVM